MALEIFCQIEKVPCESNIKGYEKWFKVESFSLGGSYRFNAADEAGAGTTDLSAVTFSKLIDKSTATLIDAVMYKLEVPKVVIEVVNDKKGSAAGGRSKHLTYTMEKCRITSFQHSSGDPMYETFSVAYRVIKLDDHFTSQKMQFDLGNPAAKSAL